MNYPSELNTAKTNLLSVTNKISKLIVSIKTKGFVVNSNKYCMLAKANILYNIINRYIDKQENTPNDFDNLYNAFMRFYS